MAKSVSVDNGDGEQHPITQEAPVADVKAARAALRAKVLAGSKPKVVPLTIGGAEVEWRQPTLQQVQDARAAAGDDDDENFIVRMLVSYTFMPGTDEKLFEPSDYTEIMGMAFGGDYQKAMNKISATLDMAGEVEAKVKNSEETTKDGT